MMAYHKMDRNVLEQHYPSSQPKLLHLGRNNLVLHGIVLGGSDIDLPDSVPGRLMVSLGVHYISE